MIPYGRQSIDADDIQSVVDVLRSNWLTTGPCVETFEAAIAEYTNARHAVAVNSGTAALHAAVSALGIKAGDEVIVPAITFAATASCIVYQGATPVFADVEEDTLLIDAESVKSRITNKTRAIIAVDYAGQPCHYEQLVEISNYYHISLIADACHALGAEYSDRRVGSIADLTAFSFHPVKHITTGEGGMVTTNDSVLAETMRRFRNHGIASDYHQREKTGSWYYEIADIGFNYRITDMQCALGLSQLRKIERFLTRRRQISERYNQAFQGSSNIVPLNKRDHVKHAYHLYVVRFKGVDRAEVFKGLREKGIGVNVHYIPVYYHPFYRNHFGYSRGLCPIAENAYEEIISLPIFPDMAEPDIDTVITAVLDISEKAARQ